jgi:hypothetical protein
MTKKNRRRASGKASNSSMRTLVASNRPTGSTTSFPAEDLVFRRQNMNIVQTPPRQMSNQIFWTKFKQDQTISVSNIAVTETNVDFTAAGFPGVSNFLACFDQYCIHSVVVTFSSNANVTTPFRIWTAIDYDSISTIGKAALLAYSNCCFASVAGDGSTSHERLIYPCTAPQLTGTSSLPQAGGVGRSWIDSAYPNIQHFGLRSIVDLWVNFSTLAVEITFTAVFGFRNGI